MSMSASTIWHKLREATSRWLEFGDRFEIVRLSGFYLSRLIRLGLM
jgi:hypothetical protein